MATVSRLAWAVLALALAGALASLFGPQQRLMGFDIGSVGATVFGFTLWVGASLFAAHPDRIFSPVWSVAERRAWVALVFIVLIFLAYLRFMWGVAALPQVPDSLSELPGDYFVWNLFVFLIAWAVVTATIRGREPDVIETDERDLRLRRSADRIGDWTLSIAVIWCVGLLVAQPAARLAWWIAPLIAANVLIGVLIGKTLVEHVYLVSRYAWDRR